MKDYKTILEGVVNIINTTEKSDIGFANICTYIGEKCPELAESEDEKIRKALINQFSDYKRRGENHGFGYSNDKILAWLEKQGEHANFRNKIQIGDKVTRNEDGVLVNLSQLNRVAKKDEKQVEQKPNDNVASTTQSYITSNQKFFQWIYDRLIYVHNENPNVDYMLSLKERIKDMQKSADKVELSTFRDKLLELFQRFRWYCKDETPTNGDIIEYVDAHIQELIDTIQKPADKSDSVLNILNKENQQVQQEDLIKKPSLKILGENEMILDEVISILDNGFMPSSWERARLVKGLQSIQLQSNSAWGEEDEKKLLCICAWIKDYPRIANFKDEMYTVANNYIDWLKSLKDRVQPKQEWSDEDERIIVKLHNALEAQNYYDGASGKYIVPHKEEINWLQSLRPQNTWKPSDEQIEALESATANCTYSEYQDCLHELIMQLKKLK